MDNLIPRFFAHTPYAEKKAEAMNAIFSLGVIPVIALHDVDDSPQFSNTQFIYALHINSHINMNGLSLTPEYIIVPAGIEISDRTSEKIIYEIKSIDEALWAIDQAPYGLVIKGNESGGPVGDDSVFILFQKVVQIAKCPLWLRGGVGVHTSAAALALGAQGIMLEEECYLFPEFGVNKDLKRLIARLDGSETRVANGRRFFINQPYWPKEKSKDFIDEKYLLEQLNVAPTSKSPLIQFGQSIGLAGANLKRFSNLGNFITQIKWAATGYLTQAKYLASSGINQQRFQQDFGVALPIAQGPMTRVSDEPEFTKAVADAGALPFFALALLQGSQASGLLQKTKAMVGDKKWGVGVLGFVPQALQEEQFEYIAQVNPPFVLVAGGNADHVKRYERIGATVLLHAPSEALLDNFLQAGVKGFVFEGRECGGHVGPLSSFVLWEKQINRLLQQDNLADITVYFAGGIHDKNSSAFISIMASPLMARGAKIGVLMGTSYLYTDAAVNTGAIQEKYQHELTAHATTSLLESSPGHVIRCLPTPFTDQFHALKQSLFDEKVSSRDMQQQLDDLNLGRLRLASKGLKRTDSGLEPASVDEQFNEGLYMVGQVASMNKPLTTVTELHEQVTGAANKLVLSLDAVKQEQEGSSEIAIIGMACIFPGAKDLDSYWKNILENKNCVTEVPKSRWDSEKFFDADAQKGIKSNSKWGGFIPETDFDPTEFGIPPQSIAAIDPAQLLSLKVTKAALVDAGYWENEDLDKENTAVIFGLEGGSELLSGYELRATLPRIFDKLPVELDEFLPSLTEDSFSGTLPNVISGRIANRLDFRGRNFVVDAACASSLAAVDVACQELASRRANLVVAGAVDLHNDLIDYLKFSSVGALSNEGTCKSFSEDAKGIALGEGVGVVILKRLSDAKRDGDKIYSVIKGIGSSSDGKSLGLTAPRKAGQIMAYQRAYKEAGISPSKVGLVEGHGTGTVVGDKTELESLTEFFLNAGATRQSIGLGSVKTQIGHTKCAAGLAALIKTSLAIYHGVKPATLHLNRPNRYYDETISPFEFCESASIWNEKHRVAGISAFGFGGTNFHLVLQGHEHTAPASVIQKEWPSELVVIRSATPEGMLQTVAKIERYLDTTPETHLGDLAYTLALESQEPIQAALLVSDIEDLQQKLQRMQTGAPVKDLFLRRPLNGRVAFLFSGQGSQRVHMLRDLFVAFPEMRNLMPDEPLASILFPKRAFDENIQLRQKNEITKTQFAQPLLGVVDLAMAKLLNRFGIAPDDLAGHSYGEIPALTFAGAINESDLVAVSQARAHAILQSAGDDPGAMVALNIDRSELDGIMSRFPELYLANHNSDKQLVIAGSTPAITEFIAHLDKLGYAHNKLRVACAFHSPLIAESQHLFNEALGHFRLRNISTTVWSNTTAEPYPATAAAIQARLCEHLVKPVQFCDQIKAMASAGVKIFIETGPGKTLTNLVASILGKDALALSPETQSGNGLTNLQRLLAGYIASGRDLDFANYFSGRQLQSLNFDTQPAAKPTQVLWRLRGNRADPIHMQMPINGYRELLAPLQLSQGGDLPGVYQSFTREMKVKEQLILDYLSNMRAMIEAQQKVMMSYFAEINSDNIAHGSLTDFADVSQFSLAPVAKPQPVSAQISHAKLDVDTSSRRASNEPEPANLATTVKEKTLDVICKKTGYPVEMLDDQMDLEADLSIDSIKRTEIINSLVNELPQLFPEGKRANAQKISSLKTISELVEFLVAQGSDFDAPQKKPAIASADASRASASVGNTKAILLAIVSERTGYPLDMLDMDMDLEADLSIDSIKRAEIVNSLKGHLSLAEDDTTKAILLRLASCKKLSEIESLLTQINTPSGVAVKKPLAATSLNHEEVRRYQFELIQTHDNFLPQEERLEGIAIGIFEDGSDEAMTLHGWLSQLGADVSMVSQQQANKELDALIYLDLSTSKNKLSQQGVFELAKSLDPANVKWFFGVSDIHTRVADLSHPGEILKELNGFYGFINSLNKEWPAICREINLDKDAQPQIASIVAAELFHTKKEETVVHYKGSSRHVNQLIESGWDTSSAHIELHADDVVLVLGGAQGITAEILDEMAAISPCNYVLVGRTPLSSSTQNVRDKTELSKSLEEIKKILLATEKFKTPKELELRARSIYKENQVLATIQRLESNNARVSYFSADLTDPAALGELIAKVYSTFGKIDGIIHAAGHLEDKLLVDKTTDSFMRVLATKLAPMQVLINEFKPSLKYFVLFSSVTSVFGNKGQIDYGTANAVFDQLANALNELIPGRVVAINWGPWKGKGMIDRALEQDFLKRGVTLIPLAEGAKAFLNELRYGRGGQAILMTPVANMERAKEQF